MDTFASTCFCFCQNTVNIVIVKRSLKSHAENNCAHYDMKWILSLGHDMINFFQDISHFGLLELKQEHA